MKKLVNNVDREIVFYNLEEAKKYFSAGSTCPVENEYLGGRLPRILPEILRVFGRHRIQRDTGRAGKGSKLKLR